MTHAPMHARVAIDAGIAVFSEGAPDRNVVWLIKINAPSVDSDLWPEVWQNPVVV